MVVPITSDKGLCGGINSTVVKYTKVIDGVCGDSDSVSSLYVVGEKGRAQLARGATQSKLVGVLVDVAKPKDGITFASASLVADSLLGTGFEKMQLVYNRFQSVISFKPTVATVLSAPALEASGEAAGGLPFDAYEAEGPDRSEFLLDLSEFHLAATLYNALLENSTSELGSRMQSMENSTKNAQEMLSKLTLYYNRTRQAAITTELIGACAPALVLRLGWLRARRGTWLCLLGALVLTRAPACFSCAEIISGAGTASPGARRVARAPPAAGLRRRLFFRMPSLTLTRAGFPLLQLPSRAERARRAAADGRVRGGGALDAAGVWGGRGDAGAASDMRGTQNAKPGVRCLQLCTYTAHSKPQLLRARSSIDASNGHAAAVACSALSVSCCFARSAWRASRCRRSARSWRSAAAAALVSPGPSSSADSRASSARSRASSSNRSCASLVRSVAKRGRS
jgi:F-type H+-transporting ATPase subunit gamma